MAGESATPALVKAESELPSRLATQTRLSPSMAMPAGPLRPPPVKPLCGEMRAPLGSSLPRTLLLLLANQTLLAELMARV